MIDANPTLTLQEEKSASMSPKINISQTNVFEGSRECSKERSDPRHAGLVKSSSNLLLRSGAKHHAKAILFASKVQPYTATIIDSSE